MHTYRARTLETGVGTHTCSSLIIHSHMRLTHTHSHFLTLPTGVLTPAQTTVVWPVLVLMQEIEGRQTGIEPHTAASQRDLFTCVDKQLGLATIAFFRLSRVRRTFILSKAGHERAKP